MQRKTYILCEMLTFWHRFAQRKAIFRTLTTCCYEMFARRRRFKKRIALSEVQIKKLIRELLNSTLSVLVISCLYLDASSLDFKKARS